jgi:hypothetical protein
MGSFTQGGIALGQSLGGGIENYVAGRERRELLVGKALGIAGQLGADDKRTDEDNKLLKKLENVNELGTRQLQSLISEFETGEELQMMGMKREILQSQVADAKAKAQSRQGLADFTSKGYGETEAGFEGDAWAVPEYLTRDYLAGDRGQKDIAAGAFPGEHYGDESRAVYEDREIPSPTQRHLRGSLMQRGGAEPAEPVEPAIEGYSNTEAEYLRRILAGSSLEAALAEETKSGGTPNLSQYDGDRLARPDASRLVSASSGKQGEPSAQLVDSQLADSSFVTASPEPSSYTYKDLVGYDTYGDDDTTTITEPALDEYGNDTGETRSRTYAGADPQRPLDRYAATGGTPDTPVDERRGQLIDSLAQYNLTPTDRKQAIDMISEKYPKLKEIATGVESPDGKSLGFTIGNTFIPARQSVGTAGAGTEGLELTSITVNDKGEVTRIMKPKEDLEKGQKVLLANAKEFKHQAEKLLKVVDSHGNWESAFSAFFSDSSATAKAELDSLAFRMAILYSKIVDPDTAAREGEVVAAKKYAFQMGFFTPNGVTKASVNSMLAEVMRRESSLYEQEGIEAPQANGAGAATNPADPVKLGI